jgi:hypothetical protein
MRFCGIVHEHPGGPPLYYEGMQPVVIMGDVWIEHTGYLTEGIRRKRFIRNWPLMAADRLRYPNRRLQKFLWIRDLSHHMRYTIEHNGNKLTPEAVMYAEEILQDWRNAFVEGNDPFSGDAAMYASGAMQALQRGFEFKVIFEAQKPELGGEGVRMEFGARAENKEQMMKLLTARLGEVDKWDGDYL